MRALRRKKPQALPAVVEAATTKAAFPARLRRPSQKARGPLPNAGLKNLGNTCFMNATLQCLFGCAEFCSGFIERQYPLSSSSPAQGKIAMAFAELLTDISQDKASLILKVLVCVVVNGNPCTNSMWSSVKYTYIIVSWA